MTWGSQRPCSVNAKKASKRAAAATARAEVSVCRPRAHVPNTIMDLYFTLFFFFLCLSLFYPSPKKRFLSQVDIHQIVTYC